MEIKRYRIIFNVLFWLSIVVAFAHLIWCATDGMAIGMESILLNVLPYGIPMLAFAQAKRQHAVNKGDVVIGGAFALSYLAMILHVTLWGSFGVDAYGNKVGFINVYFNMPLVYLIPIALFGIAWMIARMKPSKDAVMVQKVLYALPFALLAAMIVHCGILSVIELSNRSLSSSAPWWVMPLVFGLIYLVAALLSCGVYVICYLVRKRKNK